MVYLVLYKGKGKIGNAITRWWTGSPYSHCELVMDGVCYSASFMDGGVRAKEINLASGNWEMPIPLPWADRRRVLWYFEQTKGRKYDWLGIFGAQLFNRRRQDPMRFFCSEWCGAAITLPSAEIYNPATLGKLCEFML